MSAPAPTSTPTRTPASTSMSSLPVAVDHDESEEECCICLNVMSLPWKNPACTHSLCFLCVKGACVSQQKCPLCRADIDVREFDKAKMAVEASTDLYENERVRWMYQGKNSGWWLFEPRQNKELEEIYKTYRSDPDRYDRKQHALVIAALSYTFDFANKVQISARGNQRRIKRTTREKVAHKYSNRVKGIGGMQLQVVPATGAGSIAAMASPGVVEEEEEENEDENA